MSSPGVSVSYELPSFAALQTAPVGTTPGVIGTATEGPAFVPLSFGAVVDFVGKFGDIDGAHFGTLAVNEWLNHQTAVTYIRVLGIGDGNRRVTTATTDYAGENVPAGGVKNAGFIVGSQQVNPNGSLGNNPYANAGGPPGRTYLLGAFMSESAGSIAFSSAGIQTSPTAVPILRGVLMAASGVLPSLSGCYTGNASTASAGIVAGSFVGNNDGGGSVGSIDLDMSKYNFVMLLNGHIATDDYPAAITASLNPVTSDDGTFLYISSSLNTDPLKLQEAGHYLYAHYDFHTAEAVLTGSGMVTAGSEKTSITLQHLQDSVFLLSSSLARNVDDSLNLAIPNFENFDDRYQAAFSPTVISQMINRKPQDLFTFHVLDDGSIGNRQLKITIKNVEPSSEDDGFGTFDVEVRKFSDTDIDQKLISPEESFVGLNLNPESDDYIGRRIGDRHTYYDFDRASWAQKIVKTGIFNNASAYIRVEMNSNVERQNISNKLLPIGFRGPYHLVTSGSGIMSLPPHPLAGATIISTATEWSQNLVEPPIPYRLHLSDIPDADAPTDRTVNYRRSWGFKTERIDNITNPNSSEYPNTGAPSFCKYFPKFSTTREPMFAGNNSGKADINGSIYDSDRFNYNMFSLENIQIHTMSDADVVNTNEWAFATYRRNRQLVRQIKSNGSYDTGRFLNVAKDFGSTNVSRFTSFTMPVQAGFDGVNIFNEEKANMTNAAATWELDDVRQGLKKGPSVLPYIRALNIMAEKTETDIQLLAIPGIRVEYVTNMAMETVEEHFNALYIMDLETYDVYNNVITSSLQETSIEFTADEFRSRVLDSSFTAAYFPDIAMSDPKTFENIFVPPSIAVLAAIGNNDNIGHPWSAPVGYTRGKVSSPVGPAIELKVRYLSGSATAVETLYNVNINPIISQPSAGLIIYGQKTLLTSQVDSALERINVRRLLIDIRRRVRAVAKYFVFEQNRETTLTRFAREIEPILLSVQSGLGIERYKVKIDMTTTTQADIENNIVRGKIYLQPMRSEEWVVDDFSTE